MEPSIISTGKYDTEINKLVTMAQVIKKNMGSLRNKEDLKQLNTKIKQINKEIQNIRSSIDSESQLSSSQKTQLQSRLSFIKNNLPSLDYLKQLGKTLSSKSIKVSAQAPAMAPRIGRALPEANIPSTLIGSLPLDLRKKMLRFTLELDPSLFVQKFQFAIPPNSIARDDAINALRYIQKANPDAGKEISEKMEKGHPPEIILHEFYTERFDLLVRYNKLDLIKEILEAERPIFALDNVQKLINAPTFRTEVESLQQHWKYYYNPEQMSTVRGRNPLTGTFTYEVFKRNQHPTVLKYCIDKFIVFSDDLKQFHDFRVFDRMLDLNRPNAEILQDVHNYLDGLIHSAHIRGDIRLLDVNDSLRRQLAFVRIRRSISAIEELLIRINDGQTRDSEKKSLILELENENKKLQEYLSGNWSRLGEMCKTDHEQEKQFVLLEAELFNLGYRITAKD